jgi:hypothetical protein
MMHRSPEALAVRSGQIIIGLPPLLLPPLLLQYGMLIEGRADALVEPDIVVLQAPRLPGLEEALVVPMLVGISGPLGGAQVLEPGVIRDDRQLVGWQALIAAGFVHLVHLWRRGLQEQQAKRRLERSKRRLRLNYLQSADPSL